MRQRFGPYGVWGENILEEDASPGPREARPEDWDGNFDAQDFCQARGGGLDEQPGASREYSGWGLSALRHRRGGGGRQGLCDGGVFGAAAATGQQGASAGVVRSGVQPCFDKLSMRRFFDCWIPAGAGMTRWGAGRRPFRPLAWARGVRLLSDGRASLTWWKRKEPPHPRALCALALSHEGRGK